MGAKKIYQSPKFYEQKLSCVMERLHISSYEYDWTRKTAYVRFLYKGEWYQFDHSVEKANAAGKTFLSYGTDVFAQLVLALEDLARMVERGIYDLSRWIGEMKYLPPVRELPQCFRKMGFMGSELPSQEDIRVRYRNLAKKMHPDGNGSKEAFEELQGWMKGCLDYLQINKD